MDSKRPYQKKYTLSDIEQYLKGALSPAQMHEMERAALQDPFLADALEGYTEQPFEVSSAHLADIHAQLNGEQDERKPIVVPMRRKTWIWQSVAAVCILLAGTAIYFLAGTEEKAADNMAFNTTVNKEKESAATEVTEVQPDSIAQHPVIIAATKPTQAPAASPPALSPAAPEAESMRRMDSIQEQLLMTTAGLKREMQEEQAFAAKAANITTDTSFMTGLALKKTPSTGYEIKGRILDADSMPVANAVVSQLRTNGQQLLTDQQGQFSFTLLSKDSAIPIKINSLGYDETTAFLHPNNANQIVLNKADQSLNEVAVTGFKPQAKRAISGSVSNSNINTSLVPAMGSKALFDTLQKVMTAYQLETTHTSPTANATTRMALTLEFNNKGMVKNIQFPANTSPELINRIRPILIQAGPWYEKGKLAKGKHAFLF